MEKYDVIVIGAGLAGITLGYLMKKVNKNVLIVEKNKLENKDKLCGGLLTKKSYELLRNIFNIDNEKLDIKKNKHCIINNANNKIDMDVEVYTIHRKLLDSYILNEYVNMGGEIISETKYEKLDVDNNIIVINNKEYQYNHLVAADGVFSQVRKQITGRNQETNFALEIIDEEKNRELEISFLSNFKGYGWIIPNNTNNIVGLGDVSGNCKIEEKLNKYLEKLNIKKKNVRGAFLPSGKDIILNSNNIFFIGDSAGLISPITGEGIYYALMSAKILSENLNKNYSRKMKSLLSRINRENFYKKYVYNEKLRNFIFSKYDNIIIRQVIKEFAKIIL